MKTKTISVIIPCYNQAQFLDEALNSVFEQTYTNWECIIVNDGSLDETELIAKKWIEKDERFKYFFKTNGGLSHARNLGLKQATGDYIQFLDSDDYIHNKKFEIQIEDLEQYDISISDYFPFEDGTNKKVFTRYLMPFFSEIDYKKEIIWDWEYRKSFPPHCVLFKKELINNCNLTFNEDLANHEDWVFWVILFYNSQNIFNNKQVLSFYRIRSGSMSTNFISMRLGFLKAAKILQVFFKNEINLIFLRLAKEKYIEIKNKNRVSFFVKIKRKMHSRLVAFYRLLLKK